MDPDRSSSAAKEELQTLSSRVAECRRCPRLVEWRERVAEEKRAAFADEEYWGRPVPGFGDPDPWLLIVGLAPAAHGANRTGRMFTGDRSGDWLFGALHRADLANQAESVRRGDGLELSGAYVTATVRCAPPKNRPEPSERANCREYLEREIDLLLDGLRVVVPLGGYAYRHVMRIFRDRDWRVPSPMPDFGHGLELELDPPAAAGAARGAAADSDDGSSIQAGMNVNANSHSTAETAASARLTLLCSYHPSQQNTFTGTLTEEMFDQVWKRALELRP